jgi:hypothetical protein
MAVAHCESTWSWGAVSPDGQNIGGFQVNLVHGYSREYLLVPEHNVRVAYAIWLDNAGWGPWSCKP